MYNGEHSITFKATDGSFTKNTWTDWFLIPTERPTITVPVEKTKFVEIPGRTGSYDLSDYLREQTTYPDRTGSFEFIIDNDHLGWFTIYSDIASYIHGQRLKMVFSDDPNYYYLGRFTVEKFSSEEHNSKLSISYRVSPFKVHN